MNWLLSLAVPGWAKWAALAVAFLATFAAGVATRGYIADKDDLEREAARREEVILIGRAQAGVSQRTEAAQVVVQEKIRTVFKTITKEVPVVIQNSSQFACSVSNGWVRLWNDASLGSVPGTPSDADAAASAVTSAEILDTYISAAEGCHRNREQLEGLQDWVRAQQNTQP